MLINSDNIQKIAFGSLILGGGGGGDINEGIETATESLKTGQVQIISLDDVEEQDGVFLTISGVGSPASETAYYSKDAYKRILDLIQSQMKEKVIGLIPCEMGGSSSFEPFIPSALLNIPVINTACDGRAHPFGIMGSLGLEHCGNNTVQAGAGGREENNTYVEVLLTGSIETTSDLIRNTAAKAGGAVVVARNPVSLEWLKEAGATDAYTLAYKLGEAYLASETPEEKAAAICGVAGGNVVCSGKVSEYALSTENALDNGHFEIQTEGNTYKLYFFNEYMALEKNGERISTFPDLIVTLDAETGEILTTPQIYDGREVIVLTAPKEKMILGKGLKYRATYSRIEEILGIDIQKYVSDIFLD